MEVERVGDTVAFLRRAFARGACAIVECPTPSPSSRRAERVTTHDTIVSACTLTIGLEWASLGKCWLEYTKWQDYRL